MPIAVSQEVPRSANGILQGSRHFAIIRPTFGARPVI